MPLFLQASFHHPLASPNVCHARSHWSALPDLRSVWGHAQRVRGTMPCCLARPARRATLALQGTGKMVATPRAPNARQVSSVAPVLLSGLFQCTCPWQGTSALFGHRGFTITIAPHFGTLSLVTPCQATTMLFRVAVLAMRAFRALPASCRLRVPAAAGRIAHLAMAPP